MVCRVSIFMKISRILSRNLEEGTSSSARDEQIILGRVVLSPKKTERTHNIHFLADDTCERRWGRALYSKVFRELKQIPRTWWIRLLVRASKTRRLLSPPSILPRPLSPASSASAIRSIPGFADRRRNCECRRPCNCESPKENGNFPPPNSAGAGRFGGGGGSSSPTTTCINRIRELSIEISIT